MIDRLRELLDRPLDPRHARAVVVLATCLTVAFALLVSLGVLDGSRPARTEVPRRQTTRPTAPPSLPPEGPSDDSAGAERARGVQDPQDDPTSRAGRDAAAENRSHRALQHLPFRHGRVSITLVGARGGKAVVRVLADSRKAAGTAWRHFLARHHDRGDAYRVVLVARSRRHG